MSLKWNNIPFFDSPFDLCDIVTQAGLSCPLAKGMHTFSTTQTIPFEAPKVSCIVAAFQSDDYHDIVTNVSLCFMCLLHHRVNGLEVVMPPTRMERKLDA